MQIKQSSEGIHIKDKVMGGKILLVVPGSCWLKSLMVCLEKEHFYDSVLIIPNNFNNTSLGNNT